MDWNLNLLDEAFSPQKSLLFWYSLSGYFYIAMAPWHGYNDAHDLHDPERSCRVSLFFTWKGESSWLNKDEKKNDMMSLLWSMVSEWIFWSWNKREKVVSDSFAAHVNSTSPSPQKSPVLCLWALPHLTGIVAPCLSPTYDPMTDNASSDWELLTTEAFKNRTGCSDWVRFLEFLVLTHRVGERGRNINKS